MDLTIKIRILSYFKKIMSPLSRFNYIKISAGNFENIVYIFLRINMLWI